MNLSSYTFLLLTLIVIAVLLGVPLMLASPAHHEMGCPFMPGQDVICATTVLEHLKHWQTAFSTILAELLLVAALALFFVRQWELATLPDRMFARIRIRIRAPSKPTLLQELFSQGILNRKESYRF